MRILKISMKYQQDQLQLYKTELVLHQQGKTISKDLFGQVWEAPLTISDPESELPYKGSKAAVNLSTKHPMSDHLYLFHWKPICGDAYNCCITVFGCLIELFTKSKYTHSAMIIRDPPWRPDLKGLYILESSLEKFTDAEDQSLNYIHSCGMGHSMNL